MQTKSILNDAPATLLDAMLTCIPGGIERQEAQGQSLFLSTDQLPKEIRGATREQLEGIGFRFGADVDELFVECKLPPGWTKRGTEHSMHNDLFDEKGRRRAGIFYKAAFYDRRAGMNMVRRYDASAFGDSPTPEHYRVVVKDGDTVIHTAGEWQRRDYERSRALESDAMAWLKANYPDHDNPFAYWA